MGIHSVCGAVFKVNHFLQMIPPHPPNQISSVCLWWIFLPNMSLMEWTSGIYILALYTILLSADVSVWTLIFIKKPAHFSTNECFGDGFWHEWCQHLSLDSSFICHTYIVNDLIHWKSYVKNCVCVFAVTFSCNIPFIFSNYVKLCSLTAPQH